MSIKVVYCKARMAAPFGISLDISRAAAMNGSIKPDGIPPGTPAVRFS